jgi:uncharacterized phiE125 gp8 family phage protein
VPLYTLLTPSSALIMSLDDAKAHLRLDVDTSDQDAVVTALIPVVQQLVEQIVGRQLFTSTFRADFADADCQGRLVIERGPIISIDALKVLRSGSLVTLAANTDYVARPLYADEQGVKAMVVRPLQNAAGGGYAPFVHDVDEQALQVTFKAGYGAAATDLPAPIIQASKLYLGDLFDGRAASRQGNLVENPAAMRLLAGYRAPNH